MYLKTGKRRPRRLPLSLAVAAAMSLSALCATATAAETPVPVADESTCNTGRDDCQNTAAPHYSFLPDSAAFASDFTILAGVWGTGAGISIYEGGGAPASNAVGARDIAIGGWSFAEGSATNAAIAIGDAANAGDYVGGRDGNLALGQRSMARDDTGRIDDSVALGAQSALDTASMRSNIVSVGNASTQRAITQVAAGTAATDAINVSQLLPLVNNLGATLDGATGAVTAPTFSVGGVAQPSLVTAVTTLNNSIAANTTTLTDLTAALNNGTVGLVRQAAPGAAITVGTGTDGAVVNFTNGTGATRTLAGVAASAPSASSTDAVNGSQLYATNQQIGANAGEIANIFTFLANVGNGTAGLVLQDTDTRHITVAAATGGTQVAMAGTAGVRTLAGVAAGRLQGDSTDSVNGAQLDALNQWIASLDGRVATVVGDITEIQRDLAGLAPVIGDVIAYDDAGKSRVTLAGAGGTLLTNVAPALIAAGSTQMVNGGQLFDFDGYFQSQLGDLDGRADDLEKQWEGVEKDIADGTLDPGHFDGDAGGERIGNVAPGIADTDGVNVGQLNDLVEDAIKQAQDHTDQQAAAFSRSLDDYKKEVKQRFKRQDERIDRVGAMSAASTHMAINASGATSARGRLAVGAGAQNGKGAVAVGYGRPVGERTYFSAGGTVSGPERSAGVGLSVSF